MHFWSILWIFLLKNGQATDASIFAKLVHMVLSTSWKVIAMTTWVQNHRHETSHGKIVGTISRKGIHNPDASNFTSPDC
jgi:hypothetical protein